MEAYIELAQSKVHEYAVWMIHQAHLYLHHPQTSYWILLEHAFVAIVLLRWLTSVLFPREGLRVRLMRSVFATAKKIPFVRRKIASEQAKVLADMERSVFKHDATDVPRFTTLPNQGLSAEQIVKMMRTLRDRELNSYIKGRVSGGVYHGGEELTKLITQAFEMFLLTNPLHSDLFPSVRKFEAEVVRMVINLLHGDAEAGGTMTSGGTESILMACKTYRDWGYATRGITEPEIVVPDSAHAAFDKAGGYFRMHVVRVPVGKDFRADVQAMRRAITRNTVMIVGSAPEFPHGVIDPIAELAELAAERGIGMHVDACLGGLLLPFAEMAGFEVPRWDFRVPGVTSISADTHKYGYAPKGSSIVMYRTRELLKHQFFVAPDWSGGIYASPSMAGSRPGALIAGCWATMLKMGVDGYKAEAAKIFETRIKIEKAIAAMPELRVLGKPGSSVVSFDSPTLSIYHVSDAMTARGWNLNTLQYPPSVHLCCTRLTTAAADDFVRDLREAVAEAKAQPEKFSKGAAAIYGLAATIPDRSLVEDLAKGYLDLVLKTQSDASDGAAASASAH